MQKPIRFLAIACVVASMFLVPILANQIVQSESPRAPGIDQVSPAPQTSYSGEVTYQVHAGKAGRIYGQTGYYTNRTVLIEMPTDMRVVISPVATVKLAVSLSVELGVTADYAIGVLAVVDSTPMYPNAGGPGGSYLAGYVAHPRVGTIGAYAKLETWTFTWERTVSAGYHTIRFYWAIASNTVNARVWGDFYCVTVWATKTVP